MMASIGDNSVDSSRLTGFVERVERMVEERKGINDDIRDILAEAKAQGYEPKMIRLVVRERAKDKDKREEEAALAETYLSAMGLL